MNSENVQFICPGSADLHHMICKRCSFECGIGKYSTRQRNKVWAFRRTPYPLDMCCIFPYRTKMNTVCIFSHDCPKLSTAQISVQLTDMTNDHKTRRNSIHRSPATQHACIQHVVQHVVQPSAVLADPAIRLTPSHQWVWEDVLHNTFTKYWPNLADDLLQWSAVLAQHWSGTNSMLSVGKDVYEFTWRPAWKHFNHIYVRRWSGAVTVMDHDLWYCLGIPPTFNQLSIELGSS